MARYDIIATLEEVNSSMRHVFVIDRLRNNECSFRCALNDRELLNNRRFIRPVESDIINLAVAIAIADREVKRVTRTCEVLVTVPVAAPEVFTEPEVAEQLSDMMYWFTGDNWTFRFEAAQNATRSSQLRFEYEPAENMEVALWSGGLDSAAGLCCRLESDPARRFIIFGTGMNPMIHGKQRVVAGAVMTAYPDRVTLKRALLRIKGTRDLSKNRYARSRGLVFMLLGAVCTLLEDQSTLYVYENGVGAINLPFRDGEVGLDHSRAVNPQSLQRVGKWLSLLLGERFTICNPFLFKTKAEMCEVFAQERLAHIPALTVSCDRRRRRPGAPMSCGGCSSCLLRRQALSACGVIDRTRYEMPLLSGSLHEKAMLSQVDAMQGILNFEDAWNRLVRKYPELGDVADRLARAEGIPVPTMQEALLRLYRRYAAEWNAVRGAIGQKLVA